MAHPFDTVSVTAWRDSSVYQNNHDIPFLVGVTKILSTVTMLPALLYYLLLRSQFICSYLIT